MPTNTERIAFAAAALDAYCTATGDDPLEEEAVIDLLADLRHLAEGVFPDRWAAMCALADRHYEEEGEGG